MSNRNIWLVLTICCGVCGFGNVVQAEDPKTLLELAEQHFMKDENTPFTEAERILLEKIPKGEVVNLKGSGKTVDNVSEYETWEKKWRIRSELIEWICTEEKAVRTVRATGLQISGAFIKGSLLLGNLDLKFPVSFRNSAIPNDIYLTRTHLAGLVFVNCHIGSILARFLNVDGDVVFEKVNVAKAGIFMANARIGGDISISGGRSVSSISRLMLSRAQIAGDVTLKEDYRIVGTTYFNDASIGGTLSFGKGRISDNFGIIASGVRVGESVKFRGIEVLGLMSFDDAVIRKDLLFTKGVLSGKEGTFLHADGLNVSGKLEVNEAFCFKQCYVSMGAATINTFDLHVPASSNIPEIDMQYATIRRLHIRNSKGSMSDRSRIMVRGMKYDELDQSNSVEVFVKWVMRGKNRYYSGTYKRLADVLKSQGDEEGAKVVLISMMNSKARIEELSMFGWCLHVLMDITMAHGYRPWRLVWICVFIVVLGWWRFRRARDDMVCTENEKLRHLYGFHPLVYSIDLFVPLIDFGQAKHWLPNLGTVSERFRWYVWGHIAAGWILSTLTAVGLTGLVRSLN